NDAAGVAPKSTDVAPVKCEPLIVTVVPPAAGPAVGFTDVTVGAGVTEVKWSPADVADVPPTVVTVTSTVPADAAGEGAVICPSVSTEKLEALVAPNFTELVPVKCEPVIVTEVLPTVGPAVGLTEVTAGASTKVNTSKNDVADVPPTVVTVTSTPPAACAGDVAVIWPSKSTVKLAAFTAPNFTEVAPVKCEPLIEIGIASGRGSADGLRDVSSGEE